MICPPDIAQVIFPHSEEVVEDLSHLFSFQRDLVLENMLSCTDTRSTFLSRAVTPRFYICRITLTKSFMHRAILALPRWINLLAPQGAHIMQSCGPKPSRTIFRFDLNASMCRVTINTVIYIKDEACLCTILQIRRRQSCGIQYSITYSCKAAVLPYQTKQPSNLIDGIRPLISLTLTMHCYIQCIPAPQASIMTQSTLSGNFTFGRFQIQRSRCRFTLATRVSRYPSVTGDLFLKGVNLFHIFLDTTIGSNVVFESPHNVTYVKWSTDFAASIGRPYHKFSDLASAYATI